MVYMIFLFFFVFGLSIVIWVIIVFLLVNSEILVRESEERRLRLMFGGLFSTFKIVTLIRVCDVRGWFSKLLVFTIITCCFFFIYFSGFIIDKLLVELLIVNDVSIVFD